MTHDPQSLMRFGRAFSIATQMFQTRMNALLAPHDLTMAQFGVMNHLAQMGEKGQEISQIARAVEVNQPAVTKMVQKFDRLGWIVTHGAGRGRRVALSEAGFGALGRITQTLGPDYGRVLAAWESPDLAAFSDHLERLIDVYEAQSAQER